MQGKMKAAVHPRPVSPQAFCVPRAFSGSFEGIRLGHAQIGDPKHRQAISGLVMNHNKAMKSTRGLAKHAGRR
jgi:hypothetical protein